MSVGTTDATVVALLDRQGRLVWTSSSNPRRIGDFAESYLKEAYRAAARQALQAVIGGRRWQQLQVVNELNEHYRVWIWPLESPEVAACVLAIHVPSELATLSLREQDCLNLLAHGLTVRAIAAQMDVAVSTIHTHIRRAREKLELPTLAALIGFAARHCLSFQESGIGGQSRSGQPALTASASGKPRSRRSEPGLGQHHVLICDWKGALKWSSKPSYTEGYNELAWSFILEHDRARYREAFSLTITQRRRQQLDVDCVYGGRYRAWLWLLDWPDAAVCVLALKIPAEMALLTPREHECLRLLSRGHTIKRLADQMDVSVSTVHTLLRRARTKLKLRTMAELVSFAARYCYPKVGSTKLSPA